MDGMCSGMPQALTKYRGSRSSTKFEEPIIAKTNELKVNEVCNAGAAGLRSRAVESQAETYIIQTGSRKSSSKNALSVRSIVSETGKRFRIIQKEFFVVDKHLKAKSFSCKDKTSETFGTADGLLRRS